MSPELAGLSDSQDFRERASMKPTYEELEARCSALAAEVYDLKHPGTYLPSKREAPTTDAWLAEVRAQARSEGINFAASRLAAAFNHGFVDKPLTEVCDVVRMILDTKEDLANSTLPAADGLSGEYAEAFLEFSADQLRQEAVQ
ncbi:hypothetical protein [Enterobacter cancerogenus]